MIEVIGDPVIIPIQPLAVQQFSVSLGGQNVEIRLQTTDVGLFASMSVDGQPDITGQLCRDRTVINCSGDSHLSGYLFFSDCQGLDDPFFSGFNVRWLLVFLPRIERPAVH